MYELALKGEFAFQEADTPYVLDVLPLPLGVAAISTDGRLVLLDPTRLRVGPIQTHRMDPGALKVAACYDEAQSIVATAGFSGVTLWDFRMAAPATNNGLRLEKEILSLACDAQSGTIAAGTAADDDQAMIAVWDVRAGASPVVQYDSIHSDDVTALQFHPADSSTLLSGSADGLINLVDRRIADEDDAVLQTFNHDASIHRADFLSDAALFALSNDEKLAIYSTSEDAAGSPIADYSNMREAFGLQYVANIARKTGNGETGAILGAGSQDAGTFRLVHLALGSDAAWKLDVDSTVDLPGAHGSEIVRNFAVQDAQQSIYTCGEDGKVKLWGPPA